MGLFSWFRGRSRAESRSFGAEKKDALERLVAALVERSHLGDQNAMAQLVVLGDQYRAGQGGARVKRSYETALRYLEQRPRRWEEGSGEDKTGDPYRDARMRIPVVTPDWEDEAVAAPIPRDAERALGAVAAFGAEGPGLSALADLPELGGISGADCAVAILAEGPPLTADAFERARVSFGAEFERCSDGGEPLDKAGFAGFVFGRAARMQAVKRGEPFALLSPTMGWELGE